MLSALRGRFIRTAGEFDDEASANIRDVKSEGEMQVALPPGSAMRGEGEAQGFFTFSFLMPLATPFLVLSFGWS